VSGSRGQLASSRHGSWREPTHGVAEAELASLVLTPTVQAILAVDAAREKFASVICRQRAGIATSVG
jgi:hypothetical protein